MFIRTVSVKRKTNTFRYVQLVHNYRDPNTGVSKTQVLYNFGRAEQLDLEAIRRLIKSLAKLLAPEEAVANLFNLEVDLIFLDTTTTYLKLKERTKPMVSGGGDTVKTIIQN